MSAPLEMPVAFPARGGQGKQQVVFALDQCDWTNFFPGEKPDVGERISDEYLVDPAPWKAALEILRPEILVTGWSTPSLPVQWIEAEDCPLRFVCHLTGAVKQIVPRLFLEQGGCVTNWGTIAGKEVAEHALLLALATLRRMPTWREFHREPGSVPATAQLRTRTLFRRRVGLHGFGHVARSLVDLLRPFGVEICAYSDGVPESLMRSLNVTRCHSLEELFMQSEIVFECEAMTPKSRGSVNAAILARLQDGAVFVNVGRGQIVDEKALFDEARNGRLHIALDVTVAELLSPKSVHAREHLTEAIISPHIAGPTYGTFAHCGDFALQNVHRYLHGEPLLARVTIEDYDRST